LASGGCLEGIGRGAIGTRTRGQGHPRLNARYRKHEVQRGYAREKRRGGDTEEVVKGEGTMMHVITGARENAETFMVVPEATAAALTLAMASVLASVFVVLYRRSFSYNDSADALNMLKKSAHVGTAGSRASPSAQWKVFIEAVVLCLLWNVLGSGLSVASQWGGALLARFMRFSGMTRMGARDSRVFFGSAALSGSALALFMKFHLNLKGLARRVAEAVKDNMAALSPRGGGGSAEDLVCHIGYRDLDELKQNIDSITDLDSSAGLESRGWSSMSPPKSTPLLTSSGWVRSNGEHPVCGYTSASLQMLVKTVFEDVDFDDVVSFWIDDGFRNRWDRCFVSSESISGVSARGGTSGSPSDVEVVRWVRKFPAFCGAREYIIARRSFLEAESDTVYVVTKAVDKCSIAPRIKRVKEYYSSWRIRRVPSEKCKGKFAVETMLLHYENLGFPHSIVRFALRTFFGWFIQGLESHGLREYVKTKNSKNLKGDVQRARKGQARKKRAMSISVVSNKLRSKAKKQWRLCAAVAAVVLLKKE